MARPVVTIASHATRASGSLARIESRIASEIWSASLSGWPSVTDSDVNRLGNGTVLLRITRAGKELATWWATPQTPGFYSRDACILSQIEVVDPRVPEQLRSTLGQQSGCSRPGRLHDRLQVVLAHLPGRGRRGHRAQDDDPRPIAQALIVAEHLVMQRELKGARDEPRP